VTRSLQRIDGGSSERRAELLEQLDGGRDPLLVIGAELVPPELELVRVLDLPPCPSISATF